jgi:hypothetical protein
MFYVRSLVVCLTVGGPPPRGDGRSEIEASGEMNVATGVCSCCGGGCGGVAGGGMAGVLAAGRLSVGG